MIYVHSRLFYLQCCHWFPAERNEMCRGICSRWERTVRRTRRPSHSGLRSFLNHTWIRSKPKKERMKLGLAYYQLSKQEGFFHVSYDISGTLVVQRWNLNSRCKNSLWYCKKNLDISLPIPITRQSLLLNSGFKVLFNKSVNFYTTLKPTYHGCQVFIWIWNKDFVAKQLTSSSFPSFECDQKKNYWSIS